MTERKTKQREAILDVLSETKRPLSRAEIHQLASEKQPGLGFATVSRAVNSLLAEARIVRLLYPGQQTRFELASDKEHPHLLCTDCQKIFDLPREIPVVELPVLPDFKVGGYEVLFFGQCKKGRGCPHHPASEESSDALR